MSDTVNCGEQISMCDTLELFGDLNEDTIASKLMKQACKDYRAICPLATAPPEVRFFRVLHREQQQA